jgi:oligoendopeptidase F
MRGDPMNPLRDVTLCLLSLSIAGGTQTALSQERDRAKIQDRYKWNLTEIYPSDDAWKGAKEKLIAELPSVEKYHGKLSESPASLLGCLDLVYRLSKEYTRLSTYASLQSDVDTRDAKHLAARQEIQQVGSEFGARTAFLQPEILKMDRALVEAFIGKEPKLEIYRHSLDDILRRKAHTGTEGEEKIIADAGLMSDAAGSAFNIFSNADFPFPEVTQHDGAPIRLDKAAFNLHRAAPNRDFRKKVFASYFGRLDEYRRTFGTQLYAEVKKDMFYMRAQKYNSCLESALDGSNIPADVYKNLVNNVNDNLGTFHRYLNLRKRLIGVDELHYYDLYVPMVSAVDLQYSLEDAQKQIVNALAPLGASYVSVVEKAFNERWIDVYPNTGKVAGAYSSGEAYDVHPYVLTNYIGKYDDVSTLAHELGHTMHSYLTNKAQPYPNASYSTFVAEVASTFNEALLMNYMLKTITDDEVRLNLLGNYLDNVKGTLFRQVQFAEFELAIHEMAERGESLTGDALDALYLDIVRKYYGHAKGICIVDDEIKAEWANIPHFYYNFYVFQYATSLTASSALSEEVIGGDTKAKEGFLNLLSAGGSDYPIALLKKAGVEMTTSQPFELLMKKMNRVMDEMEKILAKRKK